MFASLFLLLCLIIPQSTCMTLFKMLIAGARCLYQLCKLFYLLKRLTLPPLASTQPTTKRDVFLHQGRVCSEKNSAQTMILDHSCREIITQEYILEASVCPTFEEHLHVVMSSVQLKGLPCLSHCHYQTMKDMLLGQGKQYISSALQERLWSSRSVLCFFPMNNSIARTEIPQSFLTLHK